MKLKSEGRLGSIFFVTLIFTVSAWTFAFVFSAIAGETNFPKGTLVKAGKSANKNARTVSEKETADVKDVEKISIDLRSSDVEIKPTDKDFVTIDFEGTTDFQGKALEISRNGKELKIALNKDLKSEFTWSFGDGAVGAIEFLKVKVGIPKSYNKELFLETRSGDIEIRDQKLSKFEAKLSSGDFKVNDSQIDDFEIKLTSGDLEIKNFTGKLSARSTSGEIDVKGFKGPSLQASVTSGEIELENVDTDLIDVRATSGDVDIKVKDAKGWKTELHATSGDIDNKIGSDPNGTRRMTVNVTSGNISVVQ